MLDEPFSGLDPVGVDDLSRDARRARRRRRDDRVLQPSARSRRASVRGSRDRRPRSAGRGRRRLRARPRGRTRRLIVRVAGDRERPLGGRVARRHASAVGCRDGTVTVGLGNESLIRGDARCGARRSAGSSSSVRRRGGCRRCSARRSAATRRLRPSRRCAPHEAHLVDRDDAGGPARVERADRRALVPDHDDRARRCGRARRRDPGPAVGIQQAAQDRRRRRGPGRRNRARGGRRAQAEGSADSVRELDGRNQRAALGQAVGRVRRRQAGADQADAGERDEQPGARRRDRPARGRRSQRCADRGRAAGPWPREGGQAAADAPDRDGGGDPDLHPRPDLRTADHQRRGRGEVQPRGRDPAVQHPPGAAADRQGAGDRRDGARCKWRRW